MKETIQKIYPGYYPSGAVQFFLDLHSKAGIEKAMSSEEIYLVIVQGKIIGTGSIRKNEICRLFILPEYHGKGIGCQDKRKKIISEANESVVQYPIWTEPYRNVIWG